MHTATTTTQTKGSDPTHQVIKASIWSCVGITYLVFLATSPLIAAAILVLVIWTVKAGSKEKMMEKLRGWKTHKIRIGFSAAAVVFSLFMQVSLTQAAKQKEIVASYPIPTITILSDVNNQGTNTEYALSFQTTDAVAATVNNIELAPNEQGLIETVIQLSTPQTMIEIVAKNKYKSTKESINIARDQTEQEAVTEREEEAQRIASIIQQAADIRAKIRAGFGNSILILSTIREEIDQMRSWRINIDNMSSHADESDQLKASLSSLTNELQSLQRQRYPVYRKEFASQIDTALWEDNVDARVSGTANGTIILTGYMFANNGNVKDAHLKIVDTLKELRFSQARYEWYEGSEYTYYDLETPNDGDEIK